VKLLLIRRVSYLPHEVNLHGTRIGKLSYGFEQEMGALLPDQMSPVSDAERPLPSGLGRPAYWAQLVERAVRENLQTICRDIKKLRQEVFLSLRWNQEAIRQMEPIPDHLLPKCQFLLDLMILLPGLPFNADQTRGRRKWVRAKYLVKANPVTSRANYRQIVQRHDRGKPHLDADGNEIRGKAYPMVDVNDIGLEIVKISADSILYLWIIGREPSSCPSADASQANYTDTIIELDNAFPRLARTCQDMALMPSLQQAAADSLCIHFGPPDGLGREAVDDLHDLHALCPSW
jgi:hypothetical protein